MSKEREPQHNGLDMDQIIHVAIEAALAHGGHVPTLFIKGSQRAFVLQIPELANTHEGRRFQMQMMGWMLGRGDELGALQQVFFVSEGWFSQSRGEQPPVFPPSADPQRIEVLTIFAHQIKSGAMDMRMLEMIRDAEGNLRELQPVVMLDKVAEQTVESPLLAGFVEGFLRGKGGA